MSRIKSIVSRLYSAALIAVLASCGGGGGGGGAPAISLRCCRRSPPLAVGPVSRQIKPKIKQLLLT